MNFIKRRWLIITVAIVIIWAAITFWLWLAEDVGAQTNFALVDQWPHSSWMRVFCQTQCEWFDIDDYDGNHTAALRAAMEAGYQTIAYPYAIYSLDHDREIVLQEMQGINVLTAAGNDGLPLDPKIYNLTTVISTYNYNDQCYPGAGIGEVYTIGCPIPYYCSTSYAVIAHALGRYRLTPKSGEYADVPRCE